MSYHIWSQRVSGGVDVFFVVSAFLMTDALLRSHERSGHLQSIRFYSNILSRITPLAYTVIAATLIGIVLFVSPVFWRVQLNEAIMAAVHLENFQLARTDISYLDRDGALSPFQQFWALSLQVQFYLTLPLVIGLCVLTQRFGNRWFLQLCTIAVLGVSSFVYAQILLQTDADAAYFSLWARYWEFSVGIFLAVLARHNLSLPMPLRSGLSILGLFVLLTWGLFDFGGARYPGIVALGPVLAAAFLILSGMGGFRGPVQKVLAHPVAISLGSLSFSIYLWHWPIFVFSRSIFGQDDVSISLGLMIMALSILTAFASKHVLEDRLRNVLRRGVFRPFLATGVVASVLVGSILFYRQTIVDIQRSASDYYKGFSETNFSGDALSIQEDASSVSVHQLLSVPRDVSDLYSSDCDPFGLADKSTPRLCRFGAVGSDKVVVLAGGSRLAHWEPLFSDIGERVGFEVVTATRSACTFGFLEQHDPSCKAWNDEVVSEIVSLDPDYVVVSGTRLESSEAGFGETVPEPFVQQWDRLLSAGIRVIALRDTPFQARHPNECIWLNRRNAQACSTSVETIFSDGDFDFELSSDSAGKFHFLDLTSLFCTEAECPIYFNGRLLYRDRSHFTRSYMVYMSKFAETNFLTETLRFQED